MCGGFTCTKNSLIGLNILYMALSMCDVLGDESGVTTFGTLFYFLLELVAFLLIGVAAYGNSASKITSIGVVGGIVACGVFLLFIAVLGLLGTVKHSQVLLFFYMLVLVLLFLVEFSVACACLAVDDDQQEALAYRGWLVSDTNTKKDAQQAFVCCGFNVTDNTGLDDRTIHPPCPTACCTGNQTADACCMTGPECGCDPCFTKFHDAIHSAVRVSGGVGLFFSLTEFLGVWVASRYRNKKDPIPRSSAFL